MSARFYTVEEAAQLLKLHPKTVLRFIRERRLRAAKMGKQYRILGSDLDVLAGIATTPEPVARVTAIVDVPDIDESLLRRLNSTLIGAPAGREDDGAALSVTVAHDPVHRMAKVVAVGSGGAVAGLLGLVTACLES